MKELILLSGLGVASLILEIFNLRKLIIPIVILGLIACIGVCIAGINHPHTVYDMLFVENTSLIITIILCFTTLCWFVMNLNLQDESKTISDYTSLTLFSLVGAFILTSYTNFTMLFLGIEILSIPMYILAGSNRKNIYSNEAAYKYLIMGAFASCFLLLGIAFMYGATASFDIRQIVVSAMSSTLNAQLYLIGLMLILFALAFKTSVIPFHFWAPDVYAGSPTRITAFMSTVIKVGALAAFFRFFVMAMGMVHPIYKDIVLSLGVLSIVFGNIIAVTQSNVKRLLAFSGISHAGFVFLAISVLTPETSNVVIYYLASYSVSGIALFWVAVELSKQNITTIPEYKGLIQKNKLLTITLIISLLSMAGIPPFAGFFAKYNVLVQLFIGNKFWVALVGILTSLIAVYYYFKLIISSVQTKDQEKVELIKLNLISKVFLVLLNLIIIGLGLFYNIIIKYI